MKSVKIEILKNKYDLKLSFKTYIKYEELYDNSVGVIFNKLGSGTKCTLDLIRLLHTGLTVNNESFNYTFEEFIDIIDDDEFIFTEFVKYLLEVTAVKDNDIVKKKM